MWAGNPENMDSTGVWGAGHAGYGGTICGDPPVQTSGEYPLRTLHNSCSKPDSNTVGG